MEHRDHQLTRHPDRMPRIVRLYIVNCVLGFVLAVVFTALILWLNIGNIWHLVTHVSGGWLAAGVFFVLNGIVFAGVQSGIAIMSLARDAPPPRGGTASHVQTARVPR